MILVSDFGIQPKVRNFRVKISVALQVILFIDLENQNSELFSIVIIVAKNFRDGILLEIDMFPWVSISI